MPSGGRAGSTLTTLAQLDVDPERTDDVLQGSVACAGIRYVFGAYDLHGE